jgi:hypothetical protein
MYPNTASNSHSPTVSFLHVNYLKNKLRKGKQSQCNTIGQKRSQVTTAVLSLAYCLDLPPSDSLGILNYGRPFFPVDCVLSPSLNLHLRLILLYIFQPSQFRSSPYSSFHQSTLKYFLNCPSLIHSNFMFSPFFLICYYV